MKTFDFLADIHLHPSEVLKEIADSIQFERKNALLDIPCGHAENHGEYETFLFCGERIFKFFCFVFLVSFTAGFLVNFSITNDSLKYLVFRDLWSRGKYVTCGDAFGADFLIYPGDPLIYHASHIVILLENSKIKPLEMITKIRLSVTVNKLCVFAYLDDDTEDEACSVPRIVYHTMTWEGNRDKEK